MRICTVVGARPQFVKAAVVSHALAEAGIAEVLVHTGQHYDEEMSRVFFDELQIPPPAANLEVGSGTHAVQTAGMMIALERFLVATPADAVLVYGDTNSTLAAALVAAKANVPLVHVEAGLRSFNRAMPEEVNRIVTDRLSSMLFAPTQTAMEHLAAEGLAEGSHRTGDVMLDATRRFGAVARDRIRLTDVLGGEVPDIYYAATVHRAENTDDRARLDAIFRALGSLKAPVFLPLHPRTAAVLGDWTPPRAVRLLPPLGYLAMLRLIGGARCVLTDSGGLQKEAYWLGTPCVTLRGETEWVETLHEGRNRLVDADVDRIVEAVASAPEPGFVSDGFGGAPEGASPSGVIARLMHTL